MFPVQVNILNPEHLLKPGMNTEVQIHVGERQGVLAVPNIALRTRRDVASAAHVLGLDSLTVQRQVAATRATDPPAASDNYIVFASRGGHIVPVPITTGLTDQDYIEVVSGLTERDSVVVLTSSGKK